MKMEYEKKFKEIEEFSKKNWEKFDVYTTKINTKKQKKVILDFFPYPSGVGLHVGHTLGYIATDIYSRFSRLKGQNVLHAMGYDAFGLPAEQFAIENNQHPSIITYKNIENIKKQLDFLGLDHDKTRTFNTTDVNYYKWTQYIFLKLYNSYFDESDNKAKKIEELEEKLKLEGNTDENIKKIVKNSRLAYLDLVEVNWCPKLGTVLSNEEVINGLSERGNHPVFRKPLKQWVLRITKYANRLIDNLKYLDWPENVKEMQKKWIGQSFGHEISFNCNNNKIIKIYTTRLETLSGAVALCISRSHPDLTYFFDQVEIEKIIKLPEKFKSIKSKIRAIHPITKEEIPIFIADYVLSYGSYALMCVPAHDSRDFSFAKYNNLKIIPVIIPDNEYLKSNKIILENYQENISLYPCYEGKNILFNKNTIEKEKEELEKKDFIEKKSYTKLRDWIFSRQRYWGEPFPMILDKSGEPYALDESELPVELPYLDNINQFKNDYEIYKPLEDCIEWKNIKFIKLKNGKVKIIKDISEANGSEIFEGTRETNTMPNWAGSCWYYLRYMDNNNNEKFIGDEAKNYWETSVKYGSVDLYLGGTEHAVLHLLYARFWHMVLYDLGYLNSKEPFQKLFNQGMILGPSYKNKDGKYFSYDDLLKKDNIWYSKSTNEELIESFGKIGKRYKNGVTPEEVCNKFSIDGLRLFMMYLGPLDQNKTWNYNSIIGMVRLLDNVYNLKINENHVDNDYIKYKFNIMLENIERDFELLKFNTAISSFIIFINIIYKENIKISLDLYKKLLIIFSPIAPHLCEYLYNNIKNNKNSIVNEDWPTKYQNLNFKLNEYKIVITVNGKRPSEILINKDMNKEEVESFVKEYCVKNSILFKKIITFNVNGIWRSNIVN